MSKKWKGIFVMFVLFSTTIVYGQKTSIAEIQSMAGQFVADWKSLSIPYWELNLRDNIRSLPGAGVLQKRINVLKSWHNRFEKTDTVLLSRESKLLRRHSLYIIQCNLQLFALQSDIHQDQVSVINYIQNDTAALSLLPEGKEWYRWLIKKYTGSDITPDSVFRYGESETENFFKLLKQAQTRQVQKVTALLYHDRKSIDKFYDSLFIQVQKKLSALFPVENMEAMLFRIKVSPISPSTAASPPGFYQQATRSADSAMLFYNFWKEQYDISDAGWLLLHEAIPGHHYQYTWAQTHPHSPLDEIIQFEYNGLFEGWACYVEQYGYELGLYAEPSMEQAYLKWNLVRSMRLDIDVGLNYIGWTMQQARNYWKLYLPGDTIVMEREILRCLRWPGQVLSYKIGAAVILALRDNYFNKKPGHSLTDFHRDFLNAGTLPLTMIASLFK